MPKNAPYKKEEASILTLFIAIEKSQTCTKIRTSRLLHQFHAKYRPAGVVSYTRRQTAHQTHRLFIPNIYTHPFHGARKHCPKLGPAPFQQAPCSKKRFIKSRLFCEVDFFLSSINISLFASDLYFFFFRLIFSIIQFGT